MELISWLIFTGVSVFVIIVLGLCVFAWLAHTLFGVSEHWLDYGVEEDEFG